MEVLPRNRSLVVWRKHRVNKKLRKDARTICEVLRELYREAETRRDELTMVRIEEAHDMAKRMQNRLKFYADKGGGAVFLVKDGDTELWLTKEEFKVHARKKKAERKAALNLLNQE